MKRFLGLLGLGCWAAAGTTVVLFVALFVGVKTPIAPDRLVSEPALAAAGLFFVGAIAGLAGRQTAGWAAVTAGTAIGLWINLLLLVVFARVMAGNTVVMAHDAFVRSVSLILLAPFAALSLGYWVVAVLIALRTKAGLPKPGRSSLGVAAGTSAAIAIMAFVGAFWLSGTEILLANDEPRSSVHRITISANAIEFDTETLAAGEVTILATVVGAPPQDLVLVDVARATVHVLETPPSGSVDYLLLRDRFEPGDWYFTAELGPGGDALVSPGRLVARFEVRE